ncbi:5-oxoprolinase subunit PxpB [Paenibacillus xylanilyticus]|uniref:5-oxoprolinase subunit PxpB n=1 Tax=Paenibacillus xylanilyticus TaxID=248903 RepID=UPI0039A24D54
MLSPLGEAGVMIRCGDTISDEVHRRVISVCTLLEQNSFSGMGELVPSFASVALFYDPLIIAATAVSTAGKGARLSSPYQEVCGMLLARLNMLEESVHDHARTVVIPVCYGGEFGPDLKHVADEHGLTPDEVIAIHASGEYLVHMIGFAPGFPYLGGLSKRIATPRRATPRLRVEAGTVGIGGEQTGVYPVATPGGWQCIGRTPLTLFRPEQDPPSLLQAGDRIRFEPITEQDYKEWKEGEG